MRQTNYDFIEILEVYYEIYLYKTDGLRRQCDLSRGYEVEKDGHWGYIVKGAQDYKGSVNLMSSKEDLLECGYFDTWKYCFSYGQSDEGQAVNYVLVDGKWKPYTECMRGKLESNWEDMVIVTESEEELPIKLGDYTLMEMRENAELFG